MLESIWSVLGNYGLDLQEIADGISSLFSATTDPDTGDAIYGGTLAPLADVPVVGELLKALAGFSPSIDLSNLTA